MHVCKGLSNVELWIGFVVDNNLEKKEIFLSVLVNEG